MVGGVYLNISCTPRDMRLTQLEIFSEKIMPECVG